MLFCNRSNFIFFRDEQPLNANKSIDLVEEDNVIAFNEKHFKNAYFAICVTDDGISIFSNDLHL